MKTITIQAGSEDRNTRSEYRRLFDSTIADTFQQALRIIHASPSLFFTGTKIAWYQKKAADTRQEFEQQGLFVPPVMIISITSRCNLACAGCYMKQQREHHAPEMSPVLLRSVIADAAALGVSIIVIAGGEPLMRKDEILSLARSFPQILFPLFTNGLLIDKDSAQEIAAHKNIVPLISFEGFQPDTDSRRGSGVYDRLLSSCSVLKKNGIFFGCSVTVTRVNIDRVTDTGFIQAMMEAGVRVFTFVEYVPIQPGTEDLVLTPDQQKSLHARMSVLEKQFPALFIGFPGDEEQFGGCLAAGRGFIHISSSGNVEPCPAAPFSDANLTSVSLKDALRSPFLDKIRQYHDLLTETNGGCALWTHRDWVQTLMTKP
ncbi:MAG: radical SAM protein [Methanoregula sp.]|jgi:MoaA/NifB/PqqE/SkfB family radical SAM enzyme|nr:radical SAM protein [Methanoregula sp.]